MKALLAVTLAAFMSATSAHKVTTVFPSGAAPLSPDALKSAIEGREFTAQPVEGPRWNLAYRKGGEFAVNAGNFTDEGKWSAGDSSVCTEGKKLKYLCNALRTKDGKLFLQRKDGEVMQLIPK
jgi:hypothetical protein